MVATRLNDDFAERVVLPPARPQDWLASPMAGVHRRMLDRVGGEEIFVLDGLFRDEYGEYAAGAWLRNPRWSRHAPFTGSEGAIIYVKVGHLGADLLVPLEQVPR